MILTTVISSSTAGAMIARLELGESIPERERLNAIDQIVAFSSRDWSDLPELNEIYSLSDGKWLDARYPPETVAGQKLLGGDDVTDLERLEGITELSSRFVACDDEELDVILVIARGTVGS